MKFYAIAGVALSALFAASPGTPAEAQQWPARQVRLIVPYPAGGNVDSAARVIADRLQAKLGQPFIVENKAGAGGLIAGEAFAKMPPDGYALFVGANGPVLFAPEIAKRDAYNWKRDFVPITSITMTPLVLEVHPSVPHYRGNAPALNDLIGGQVQFALDQISVGLPSIKSGMLRALAVTGSHRTSWLPDVPTFTELGYKEFDGQTFTGLFAPARTPPEVVTRLHETLAEILKDPAIIEKFNALGAEAVSMTPAEFTSYLEREDAKWIPVVRRANIKAD
jgi:tripartite-type tricarboxylate transporter receptor subunit TctC